MELYLAIRNILKYQGQQFLKDEKFVNALSDFNGFEENKALKNIYRILFQEGYIEKAIKQWSQNNSLVSLTHEIEDFYGIPVYLSEYILESVIYGLGHTIKPELKVSNGNASQTNQSIKQPIIYEIDSESFKLAGLTVSSTFIGIENNNIICTCSYNGIFPKLNEWYNISFSFLLISGRGDLLSHLTTKNQNLYLDNTHPISGVAKVSLRNFKFDYTDVNKMIVVANFIKED